MNSGVNTQDFEEIYQKYKNTLYRIAFTYLKNNVDVEDVLQDVFLKRFYKSPKFKDEKHEKYWLIRITINLCKDTLRSFWNKNVKSIDELMESQEIIQWDFSEDEKYIFREVMSLPDKQKTVMYLYYYERYSCKEIAEILKCSESAVKMRLKKGRELLKINLEKEDFV